MSILTRTLRKEIDAGCLSGNSLAVTLLSYYCKGAKYITATDLAVFAKSEAKTSIPPDTTYPISGDLRFKRLLVRGIRKYPTSSMPISNDGDEELMRYYTVGFCKNNLPCPSVFLGSNGVGKSSIYAALEQISLQNLFSAQYRGYSSLKSQREYLIHQNSEPSEVRIILETENGEYSYSLDSEDVQPLAYPAFFCMEYDIEQLTKKIKPSYIASQLGIQDYHQLLMTFSRLDETFEKSIEEYERSCKELKETVLSLTLFRLLQSSDLDYKFLLMFSSAVQRHIEISDRHDRRNTLYSLTILIYSILMKIGNIDGYNLFLKQINETFQLTFDRIDTLRLKKPYGITEKDIEEWYTPIKNLSQFLSKNIENDIKEVNVDKFELKYNETIFIERIHLQEGKLRRMEEACPLLGIGEPNKKGYDEVVFTLRNSYADLMGKVVETSRDVFACLFKPYFNNDISDLRIVTSGRGENIDIEVIARSPLTGINLGGISPRKYLNTFRFKVFCVSLKVSLAITCMKMYDLNFPIVIDDVFDSSDFSNREKIKDFIRHLYEAYDRLMGESMPLQLIFFTQDDIIGDSVSIGIFNSNTHITPKYSRIFDYTEARASDSRQIVIQPSYRVWATNLEDPIKL